ncbi:hypothetical protein ACFE04_000894 [Oxalis oulophora]
MSTFLNDGCCVLHDEFEKAIAAKNIAREKRIQEREENPDLNLDSETSSGEESLDNDDYSRIKRKSKKGRINCEGHLAASVRKAATGSRLKQQKTHDMVAAIEEIRRQNAEEIIQIQKKHAEDMEKMRRLIADRSPPM